MRVMAAVKHDPVGSMAGGVNHLEDVRAPIMNDLAVFEDVGRLEEGRFLLVIGPTTAIDRLYFAYSGPRAGAGRWHSLIASGRGDFHPRGHSGCGC